MSEKRTIARNTIANGTVKFLQLAASFVFMPYLINGFGLANYGLFMLAGSLSVYLGLLDLGVNPTVIKRVAEYRARNEGEEVGRIVSNSAAYYVLVGAFVAAALALFARFGVPYLPLSPADSDLAYNLFMVAALLALFSWPLGLGSAVLSGLQRYDLVSLVGAGVVVVNLTVTALVVLRGEGPVVLLAGLGLVAITGGVVSSVIALVHLKDVRLSVALITPAGIMGLLRFGWRLFVLQGASMLSGEQTDRFVLAGFVGPAAVGLFEAPAKLSSLVGQLAALPVSALVPASSQMDAQQRAETLRALFLRGTKYTLAFVAPVTVVMMTLAHPFLTAWLGPELATQAVAAQVLLIGSALSLVLTVAFNISIGMGRVSFWVRYSVVAAVLNLALSVLLVVPFRVLGVVLGTVIADAVMFPFGLVHVLREHRVELREFSRDVLVPTLPFSLVGVAVAVSMNVAGAADTLVGVAVAGVVAVGVAWAATVAFGFSEGERDEVGRFAEPIAARFKR